MFIFFKGSKEAAFAHAIISASIAYKLTQVCEEKNKSHNLTHCRCTNIQQSELLISNFKSCVILILKKLLF